uniref:Uncharacterized protein n=1 Tax=Steinernema glaseri TaxID=37863 RepID=A0A1I7Z8V5_9BILA
MSLDQIIKLEKVNKSKAKCRRLPAKKPVSNGGRSPADRLSSSSHSSRTVERPSVQGGRVQKRPLVDRLSISSGPSRRVHRRLSHQDVVIRHPHQGGSAARKALTTRSVTAYGDLDLTIEVATVEEPAYLRLRKEEPRPTASLKKKES